VENMLLRWQEDNKECEIKLTEQSSIGKAEFTIAKGTFVEKSLNGYFALNSKVKMLRFIFFDLNEVLKIEMKELDQR
jgi:hypothetical protein